MQPTSLAEATKRAFEAVQIAFVEGVVDCQCLWEHDFFLVMYHGERIALDTNRDTIIEICRKEGHPAYHIVAVVMQLCTFGEPLISTEPDAGDLEHYIEQFIETIPQLAQFAEYKRPRGFFRHDWAATVVVMNDPAEPTQGDGENNTEIEIYLGSGLRTDQKAHIMARITERLKCCRLHVRAGESAPFEGCYDSGLIEMAIEEMLYPCIAEDFLSLAQTLIQFGFELKMNSTGGELNRLPRRYRRLVMDIPGSPGQKAEFVVGEIGPAKIFLQISGDPRPTLGTDEDEEEVMLQTPDHSDGEDDHEDGEDDEE